jgi:hypothetical protein
MRHRVHVDTTEKIPAHKERWKVCQLVYAAPKYDMLIKLDESGHSDRHSADYM